MVAEAMAAATGMAAWAVAAWEAEGRVVEEWEAAVPAVAEWALSLIHI